MPLPGRLAVLYVLTGLLIVLLGTMLLRYVVFGFIWVASGASFWILPNMMSETVRREGCPLHAGTGHGCRALACGRRPAAHALQIMASGPCIT